MKLYIVRHGVTDLNATNVRQSPGGNLSEEGKKQAEILGKRFLNFPFDIIFSSPFPRALQTAEIIASKIKNVPVRTIDILEEVRYPSEIIGKPKDDPRSRKVLDEIQAHFEDPNWRYSDEETFNEFMTRAHKVLDAMLESKFENVVLVSHERFIRVLIGVVLLGVAFTPAAFRAVRKNLYVSNTGVTVCVKDSNEGGAWRLH